MEFLRKLLGEQESSPVAQEVDEAFALSQIASQEAWQVILKHADKMASKGKFMGAAIMVMSTVWQILDIGKNAMKKTEKTHGKTDNMVSTMWEGFEATFLSKDAKEAQAKLKDIAKRRGL